MQSLIQKHLNNPIKFSKELQIRIVDGEQDVKRISKEEENCLRKDMTVVAEPENYQGSVDEIGKVILNFLVGFAFVFLYL